jgi:hypothetical protein
VQKVMSQKSKHILLILIDLVPSWLVWADIECTMQVALPKRPINQFQPVQQSRQQTLMF